MSKTKVNCHQNLNSSRGHHNIFMPNYINFGSVAFQLLHRHTHTNGRDQKQYTDSPLWRVINSTKCNITRSNQRVLYISSYPQLRCSRSSSAFSCCWTTSSGHVMSAVKQLRTASWSDSSPLLSTSFDTNSSPTISRSSTTPETKYFCLDIIQNRGGQTKVHVPHTALRCILTGLRQPPE